MYYKNNVVGSLNLFEVMAEFGCNNLIFSSSATVYQAGELLDEESPIKPSNPYGETKISVEYMVSSNAKVAGGSWINLRYFNPVGSSLDGLLGDSPSIFPNNLFPFIE
jgi:UDP-glucose 4-epimerase